MNPFTTSFSDMKQTWLLRFNPRFLDPNSEERNILNRALSKHVVIKLRYLCEEISQGPTVRTLDAVEGGDIGLITIENIRQESIEINPLELHWVPKELVSEQDLLRKGDILTPRVRGVGNVSVIRESARYVASENVLIVRLDDRLASRFVGDFIPYYLAHVARRQVSLLQTGGESGNINQDLLKEVLVPLLDPSVQTRSLARICSVEQEIKAVSKDLLQLQDIIDQILCQYEVKRLSSLAGREVVVTSLSRLAGQTYLRLGAQYRSFYENHNGLLFDDDSEPRYRTRRLGELMRPYPATVLKKDLLEEEYILIELENIESLTGRIIVDDNVVKEIGSDKIVFGDCDLLVGKLRPYLGYAVLNDKAKPYIGTTELLPFTANKDLVSPEYLRYLLLSTDFIHISAMLMYGKEHPRIHPRDILSIRVPCPPIEIQESIVNDMRKCEQKNQEIRGKIGELRQEIDRILWEFLLREE